MMCWNSGFCLMNLPWFHPPPPPTCIRGELTFEAKNPRGGGGVMLRFLTIKGGGGPVTRGRLIEGLKGHITPTF